MLLWIEAVQRPQGFQKQAEPLTHIETGDSVDRGEIFHQTGILLDSALLEIADYRDVLFDSSCTPGTTPAAPRS